MERRFKFSEGEYYHVYNRGNNKGNIFLSNKDKDRFLKLVFLCNNKKPVILKLLQGLTLEEIITKLNFNEDERIVNIGAYCLMQNHFHLLFKEEIDGGISHFMKKLSTAYSMYMNKKYNRSGKLFEGAFLASHVNTDTYLKYLFSYIHLNPVKYIEPEWKKVGVVNTMTAEEYLNNYKYSSYLDYVGKSRPEGSILNKEAFPEYFSSSREFTDFIKDFLLLQGETLE